jgi:hypothetical protein
MESVVNQIAQQDQNFVPPSCYYAPPHDPFAVLVVVEKKNDGVISIEVNGEIWTSETAPAWQNALAKRGVHAVLSYLSQTHKSSQHNDKVFMGTGYHNHWTLERKK